MGTRCAARRGDEGGCREAVRWRAERWPGPGRHVVRGRRSRPLQLREPLLIEAQDVRELRDSILRGGLCVVREIPQDVVELLRHPLGFPRAGPRMITVRRESRPSE